MLGVGKMIIEARAGKGVNGGKGKSIYIRLEILQISDSDAYLFPYLSHEIQQQRECVTVSQFMSLTKW